MKLYLVDMRGMLYKGVMLNSKAFVADALNMNGAFISDIRHAGGTYLLINRLLSLAKGNDVIICCDSETNFRKDLYPAYKSTRLRTLNPDIRIRVNEDNKIGEKILRYFGIPVVYADYYEADDIIATAVRTYKDFYEEICIIADDSDLNVLIDKNVSIIGCTKKSSVRTLSNTKESYDTSLEKAIFGDRSDDIPKLYLMQDTVYKMFSFPKEIKKSKQAMLAMLNTLHLSVAEKRDLTRNINLAYLNGDLNIDFKPVNITPNLTHNLIRVLSELDMQRENAIGLTQQEKISILNC